MFRLIYLKALSIEDLPIEQFFWRWKVSSLHSIAVRYGQEAPVAREPKKFLARKLRGYGKYLALIRNGFIKTVDTERSRHSHREHVNSHRCMATVGRTVVYVEILKRM